MIAIKTKILNVFYSVCFSPRMHKLKGYSLFVDPNTCLKIIVKEKQAKDALKTYFQSAYYDEIFTVVGQSYGLTLVQI